MTKEKARLLFTQTVAQDECNLALDRAALLLAAEEYPNLRIENYLGQLDELAEAALKFDDSSADPFTRIARLNHLLFDEAGFRGNVGDYYDARNSFLNNVLDRRTGIPISLSIIYLEIGRRMGLNLTGVGLPGHFIVKYVDTEQEIFIDPFHGGRLLSEEQCHEIVAEMYNKKIDFQPSFLCAVSKKQILARMLQNLKGIYTRSMDHHKTLSVIERILLIKTDQADAITEIRDRGLVYLELGQHNQARADLEEYVRHAPMNVDVAKIKEQLAQLRRHQAQLN